MNKVEQIFGELLEMSPADRNQRLEQVQTELPEVHAQVVPLLQAHEQAGSFLRAAGESTAEFDGAEHIGKQIRQYKLREMIGEGGMGVVYVAEQEKPLRRKVALKVIKPGMDSKAILARFDAERQALALMNHPNIAKVLDAGTTPEGRPYFVMELVSGQPITQYCDAQKLTIRERLDLFTEVCQAIQHAHQKGIIHRDIKPSNVLVTELDGKPVAKVIDFGVAKALNQSLTEHSIYTAHQAVIGTPLYMSPEQASFSAVDVDTRSDVYSLGVLLYELLTGTTPFTGDDFKQAAQEEVFRLIRELEPPRPSNRISSLGATATQISSLRRTQPDQLGRTVKGDLDWIVMKALCKERGRRYDSAAGLGRDVSGYMKDGIVEARPPSLTYQLYKLYARNRHLAAVLGVIAASMIVLIGVLVWSNASQRALTKKLEAKNDELQSQQLELETANSELVDEGFTRVFELAQSGRLDEARDVLDQLAESSDDEHRIRLYRDVVNLFGNEEQRREARDDLLKLDTAGTDLRVKSMLVLSFILTDDEWSYHDRVAELYDFTPSTFEEFLFRGAAFTFSHPVQGRKDLENAVLRNPESSVAHILLSQVLQSYTMDRRCEKEELLYVARECYFEALVGARTSSFGNVNATIAFLDAHCSLFLCLQEASSPELSAECIRSWKDGLVRSFETPYDPQLHRAQIDSYRILSRFQSPLASEIEKTVLCDPENSEGAREAVIKLIQVYLLKRDDRNALRLARKHRAAIRDFDLMAVFPIISSICAENGLTAAKEFVHQMIEEQSSHPIASALNWKVLTLLRDEQKAIQEADSFREFCTIRPLDPRAPSALLSAEWMLSPIEMSGEQADQILRTDDNAIYQFQLFNEATHLLAIGRREEAKIRIRKVRDNPNFRVFINGWAEVFLERLEDPEFLPWLKESEAAE